MPARPPARRRGRGSSGRVLAQRLQPVRVHDGLLGPGRDDDQVAVPRCELLERREQLLALRPALDAAQPLLRPRGRSARSPRARPRRAPSRPLRPPGPPRAASPQRPPDRGRARRTARGRPAAAPRAGPAPPGRAGARRGRACRRRRGRATAPRSRRARARARRGTRARRARKTPEGDELAARADRRRERAELVRDEHDHRVRRRLLEILQQRVGGVLVQQVRVEDHVDAAVGLVRAHVQVAVERAHLVDPDHLAERLEQEEVGVRPGLDAALLAEQRRRRRRAPPRACRRRPARAAGRRARGPRRPRRPAAAAPPAAQAGRRSSSADPGGESVGVERAVEDDDSLREERGEPLVPRGHVCVEGRAARSIRSGSPPTRRARRGWRRSRARTSGRAAGRRRRAGSARAPRRARARARCPGRRPSCRGSGRAGRRRRARAPARSPRRRARRAPRRTGAPRPTASSRRRAGRAPGSARRAPCRRARAPSPPRGPRPRARPAGARPGSSCRSRRGPRSSRTSGGGADATGRIRPCGRWSPEERASSARTSSRRCSRAATRCTSSTTSRPAGARTCNAAATLHELDIREPLDALFDEVRPETVVHLAAQADVGTSVERPVLDAEVNVLGTLNVLEAARPHGAQLVFSSTGGAIYGECERPAREDDPRRPVSPYGTAKLAAEEYLATWNRLYGTRHVALRFANVYGPRQLAKLEGGVVAIFTDRLRAGEGVTIFGDGGQTRDFVYVGDVVEAVLAAIGARRRRLQRRHRRGDLGARALRRLPARLPASRPRPSTRPRGRATRCAASSTSRWPSASSAGGRRRRSSRGCARPGARRVA